MIKIERNTKKLTAIADGLNLVAESLNLEVHSKKSQLIVLEQMNLSVNDNGILDDQVNKLKDDVKFIDAQLELVQSCISVAISGL